MSEEISQPTPTPENKPVQADVSPTPVSKRKNGILNSLPDEVKTDMETYMPENSPAKIKRYMVLKYGEKFPFLAKISPYTFKNYKLKYAQRISELSVIQQQTITPPAELITVIDTIGNSVTSVDLEDKRSILRSLLVACASRAELMEKRNIAFLDPMLENLILANRREQRMIVDTVSKLGEQLEKTADKDFIAELDSFTAVLVSCVVNTYRLTHVEDMTRFQKFMSDLKENFKKTLESYKLTKEKLNSESK